MSVQPGRSLPSIEGVAGPRWRFFTRNRWWGQWAVRRWFRVDVLGAQNVPADGPVIFASNHIGFADGPLLAIFAPRPVHALTKIEFFQNRLLAWFLRGVGQIPLDRFNADPGALKMCLRALADGRAVGIYPEGTRGAGELDVFHHGAAYLALVSGAPVVPVTMFGSRVAGGKNSLPPRGSTITMVCGRPIQFDPVPWPRTKQLVTETSATLREHMLRELKAAMEETGLSLPGPLHAGETVHL